MTPNLMLLAAVLLTLSGKALGRPAEAGGSRQLTQATCSDCSCARGQCDTDCGSDSLIASFTCDAVSRLNQLT